MVDYRRWWEKFPEVLEAEKAALTARGLQWKIDEGALATGRLAIEFVYPLRGEERQFTGVYPDAYPYFAPQVLLHGDQLSRHHNPEGVLCLLSNDGEAWQPLVDTLATLLSEQVPLIQATTSGELEAGDAAAAEDRVGEPLTNYLNYDEASSIIVPDATPPRGDEWGRLEFLGRRSGDLAAPIVTAILRQIQDPTRKSLIDFDLRHPAFEQRLTGFWARLAERPAISGLDSDAAYSWMQKTLVERCPAFQKALDAARAGDLFICGLVYSDEKTWRSSEDDWLFLAVVVKKARKGAQPPKLVGGFVRTDWGGDEANLVRAPFLRPLRNKCVALIGAGAIGAPVALQLAKSGVRQIHLVDSDRLQVGNSVRWALGWNGAGYPKAHVLADHISREYPRTQAVPHRLRIGAPNVIDGKVFSNHRFLTELLEKADLVIDASANYRVSHYLSDLAREYRKSYLWLTTTPGCFGGVVGRIRPLKTAGCWHCFQRSLATGHLRMPADSAVEMVQPGGCMQATFIGAGVDGEVISQLASRLALATLCDGDDGGYPDFSWDVAVGDLNGPNGPLPATWETYPLDVHPDCTAHKR